MRASNNKRSKRGGRGWDKDAKGKQKRTVVEEEEEDGVGDRLYQDSYLSPPLLLLLLHHRVTCASDALLSQTTNANCHCHENCAKICPCLSSCRHRLSGVRRSVAKDQHTPPSVENRTGRGGPRQQQKQPTERDLYTVCVYTLRGSGSLSLSLSLSLSIFPPCLVQRQLIMPPALPPALSSSSSCLISFSLSVVRLLFFFFFLLFSSSTSTSYRQAVA